MKPFSLDAVLDFREKLEEQAQARLFDARKTVDKISARLDREQTLAEETIKDLERMQREGIEIGELIRYEEQIIQLSANIDAIRKNLEVKKKIVQKEHDNLVHCSKEHQIMKRLKEEKNRAWREHLNKKEAAMLDEIGVLRYDNNTI